MKKGRNAPEEQFLLLSTIFCYLVLDFYKKTMIRFSLRDKRLFEIIDVEITRVDYRMQDIDVHVTLNMDKILYVKTNFKRD